MTFQYHNLPPSLDPPPVPFPSSFTLTAPPGSDIWKKPPNHNAFNAPICYRALPLSSFRRARVTVTAEWKTQFDQGGLCLIILSTQAMGTDRKWIKTGIEMYDGEPKVSTVACDRWADWSLFPLSDAGGDRRSVTVQMERELKDWKPTSTLWVFVLGEDGTKKPIREITWAFEGVGEEEEKEKEEQECWVGIYAAKPTKDKDDKERGLEVVFHGLTIEGLMI